MKRIIRLTETDLTRLVRRIIKEQAEDNKISLKVYETKEESETASNDGMFQNIDLFDIKLQWEYVEFKYSRANSTNVGEGFYKCKANIIKAIKLDDEDFYPTKIGIEKLEPFCQRDKYAQNNSSSRDSGLA
jgi:hypothetical protein